ncbi:hypothetical protein KBI33_03010 [Candidatus Shapirobacteria bacterium]|nr:hypothetical protein [Candidatus Shapirobacteria bacterium]
MEKVLGENFPFIELNPVWVEHEKSISSLKEAIKTPKTEEGKKIMEEISRNTILKTYPRLAPILSGLVSLVEYEEIGEREKISYFAEPTTQLIVQAAFRLLVEQTINSQYEEGERGYKSYQDFYNQFIEGSRGLDRMINLNSGLPNLVNSIGMVINHSARSLEGASNFEIKMEAIRKGISESLRKSEQSGKKEEPAEAIKNELAKIFSSDL